MFSYPLIKVFYINLHQIKYLVVIIYSNYCKYCNIIIKDKNHITFNYQLSIDISLYLKYIKSIFNWQNYWNYINIRIPLVILNNRKLWFEDLGWGSLKRSVSSKPEIRVSFRLYKYLKGWMICQYRLDLGRELLPVLVRL